MRTFKKLKSEKGFALTVVAVFTLLSSLVAGTYMAASVNEIKNAQHQVDSTQALYLAESGLQRAMYELKTLDEDPTLNLPTTTYTMQPFNLNSAVAQNLNYRGDTNINIQMTPIVQDISYRATATVTSGTASKTLYAVIRYQPPSTVFDYIYFINNWGWLYGSGIRMEGDNRSNGRFDLRYDPTINGHIYASKEVDTHGGDILGLAGTVDGVGGYPYQHPNASKIAMPNLSSLTDYENMAISQNASISIGGVVKVNGIYGNEAGETNHLVLIGTDQNPIVVNGPNVIRGDVIIKGVVTGHGTIYSGRNMYVAGNINYADGPTTPRPTSNSNEDKDSWYNTNKDKDIIAFAAKESVIMGDYTSQNGGSWYASSYLFSMGSEDVGVDGILGTGDAGEGDGIFSPAFEDLDGDGSMDSNYGWSNVQTSVAVTQFSNLPAGATQFSHLATNSITRIDGIFYTNHAFAGRTGNNIVINGSIISKDEAIVFRDYITMNYDERINSRYTKSNPNWLIDLGLPISEDWGIQQWQE